MNEKYDLIIGLEIHIQSKTESKMFCPCSTQYFQKDPNTCVCPVCLGLPGALPVPNRKAIENCIKLGLATNCKISNTLRFDRKHYFYPDLPKGYQISQYDMPLCSNGVFEIFDKDGNSSVIEIERIHQEEDVAKSTHGIDGEGREYSAIDYNKSGVPLIEMVTKPVIKSASQAKEFANSIRQLVRWLNISNADMEKGQMRCEPNISIQEKGKYKVEDGKVVALGDYKLNPKVEVKNIGSISAIEKAITYEYQRMTEELENGGKLTQQTRGWDPISNTTVFQRSKESAADYRYFPDPDIPLITICIEDIENIKNEIDSIPTKIYKTLIDDLELSPYDSSVITSDIKTYGFFMNVFNDVSKEFDKKESAKEVANWMTGIMFSLSNELDCELTDLGINTSDLIQLIKSVKEKKIIISKAKEILTSSVKEKSSITEKLNSLGSVISNDDEIESILKKVIENNPKPVSDYKSGKETVIMFLVGQVMKETKGMIEPNKAKEKLIELLK